jgi:hypothetical protein
MSADGGDALLLPTAVVDGRVAANAAAMVSLGLSPMLLRRCGACTDATPVLAAAAASRVPPPLLMRRPKIGGMSKPNIVPLAAAFEVLPIGASSVTGVGRDRDTEGAAGTGAGAGLLAVILRVLRLRPADPTVTEGSLPLLIAASCCLAAAAVEAAAPVPSAPLRLPPEAARCAGPGGWGGGTPRGCGAMPTKRPNCSRLCGHTAACSMGKTTMSTFWGGTRLSSAGHGGGCTCGAFTVDTRGVDPLDPPAGDTPR